MLRMLRMPMLRLRLRLPLPLLRLLLLRNVELDGAIFLLDTHLNAEAPPRRRPKQEGNQGQPEDRSEADVERMACLRRLIALMAIAVVTELAQYQTHDREHPHTDHWARRGQRALRHAGRRAAR